MKWNQWRTWIRKNKTLIILIAGGILLLTIPLSSKSRKTDTGDEERESFSLQEQEKRLEKVLSEVQGAGKVSVLLSLEDYGEVTLAEDKETSSSDGTMENKSEVVILSDGSRAENPAILRSRLPRYQGALVVAEGAGNAQVRLKITLAVQSITGLGSDKIAVIQ